MVLHSEEMSDRAEMAATAPRLLRVVNLFQRSPSWSAEALAAELDITSRTVRRDVARLRDLGYPVQTSFGPGGGYAMPAGAALPPLLFEADEAATVMLSLLEAAAGTSHATDAAVSALEKLRQVMPPRLRTDTEALRRHSSDLRIGQMVGREPRLVDVGVLILLARACQQRRRVHEQPDDASNHRPQRTLEPLHLVRTMDDWYLVAYVLDDHAWRPLRVDRLGRLTMSTASSTYRRYDGEVTDLVAAHVQGEIQSVTGTVRVHAPASVVAPWTEPAWGRIIEESPTTTIVEGGADTYLSMARWLSLIDAEITVLEPHELRQAFAELAKRAARTARSEPG
jgi:predicted DNA-binding transcriptional regulator YafY